MHSLSWSQSWRLAPERISVLIRSAVALALIAGLGTLLYSQYRQHWATKNFGVVIPGEIFRSGYLNPRALKRVHAEYGIRTIIDLGGSEPNTTEYRNEVATAESLGIQRFEFVLPGDGTGDPKTYVKALQIMADRNKLPLLVHCGAGTFRTSTAVILYLNLYRNVPLWDAVLTCRRYGYNPYANPRHLVYLAENLAAIRMSLGFPPADHFEQAPTDKADSR